MTTPKKTTPKTTKEPVPFPVTLNEFLSGVSAPESRRAFGDQMAGSGKRDPGEWRRLYNHWMAMPTGATWSEWLKKDRKA